MATVKVTIDGRPVEVEAGTSVLDAARQLGIEIPTLCHVEGLEPAASCFLCAVQIEGSRTTSPACAMPVSDGMTVATDTPDIRASRRMALELLLSDHAGDCIAPCTAGCPAGLDIAGYVYEIASGDVGRAMDILYERLSIPGTLGRICPRLCEKSCRRGEYDRDGLAIAALHRYAADRNAASDARVVPRPGTPTGKSVGIIGAGPAGLTAAFYLLRRGHACTLYDTHPRPGGMLRYGIPAYRLPRAALDDEIATVEGLGATFRMGRRWGRDFSLADLRRDHDAVFVAVGAQRSSRMRCDGEDLAISGLGYLHRVAEGGSADLGRNIVVVGGGNTAMDAARTVARTGAAVTVLYRRTRREMPCLMDEVEGAEEEGVRLEFLVAPVAIARRADGGSGLTLTCRRMELGEPDASGRRRPVPVRGSEFEVVCNAVVAAVGQSVERSLAEAEGLGVTGWGIAAEHGTLATNLPGVFAGGDAVLGADVAVRAVAAGRVAAVSIDQHLSGLPVTGPRDLVAIAMTPIDDGERAALFRQIEASARVETRTLSIERRLTSFDEVDHGLAFEHARRESMRCLTCGCRKAGGCTLRQLSTEYDARPYRFLGARRRFEQDTSHPEIVFEPGKCILCDACVRIAAEANEKLGVSIVGRGFDVSVAVPFGEPLSDGLREAAARCAAACPTGAIALRSARSCDLASCGGGCPLVPGSGGAGFRC